MSVNAKPLYTYYKNQGEFGYKIGIEVVDVDGEPVTITGDVNFIFYDTLGIKNTKSGLKTENTAYYDVLVTDFLTAGSYRFWMQCFNREIYGPFELKILKV